MPVMPEYTDTQDSDTINTEAPDKDGSEGASAIRERKMVNVHPEFYGTVKEQCGFNPEALMVALSHLLNNKDQGVGFFAMGEAHKVLWLRTWLGKDYR
ncbi:hypothetical protein D1007_01426 [Hordeum vulgare]|nr:hypothetical protein D1007_01426 [Hordeum vulgare]